MAIDKREVLRSAEADYLLDYAIFTGTVRVYVTHALEEHFVADKSDRHRRMFLLAVFREEYSAFEDLGAMLDALLTHRQKPEVPLLERLISYGVGEVELRKVMDRFCITSPQTLYDGLGLSQLIPATWNNEFPTLDIEKALRTAANFFFVDCVRNQKKDGLRAFNKLKHGLLVVPNAKRYLAKQIDAPGALYKTDKEHPEVADNPFTLYSVPMIDDHLEGRLRSIYFIQANLRLIVALLVIERYPEAVVRRCDNRPLDLMRTPFMADVLNFVEQVSKSSNGAPPAGEKAG